VSTDSEKIARGALKKFVDELADFSGAYEFGQKYLQRNYPKPKKTVTRPRVVKYDGTAFSLRNYDGREGVGVGGYLHASDDGGKRWFKVKLVPWNGPTDAFLCSNLPDEGFAEMANDLFQNPTETVDVDDE